MLGHSDARSGDYESGGGGDIESVTLIGARAASIDKRAFAGLNLDGSLAHDSGESGELIHRFALGPQGA
jgi:hypothetical protein